MKTVMKVVRIVIALVFVWPIFPMAILGLLLYCLFSLLHLRKLAIILSRSIYYAVCWWMLVFLGGWIHVEGRENLPPKDEGVIYAPNHNSICDVPLFYFGARRFPAMMGKAELFKVPLVHGLLLSLDCIKIGRQSAHGVVEAIRESVKRIEKGGSLVIFPEGTRSKTGEIGRFKSGAFKVAERTGCRIVPVVIKNDRALLEGAGRFGIVPIYIKFLPPIDTSSLSEEEKKDLGPIVEKEVREEWEKYPSWPKKK